jgi:DNA repair protein RadC
MDGQSAALRPQRVVELSVNDEATHAARHAKIRERFLSGDAASHTDEGLLELLLTFGMPSHDVQPLTRALLARFSDFNKVLDADVDALRSAAGIESDVPTLLKLVDRICRARPILPPEAQSPSLPGGLEAKTLPLPGCPAPERTRTVPLTQSEMPLNLPGQPELPLAQKAPAVRERKTIQDVLLAEGLLALKLAHEAKSPEELQDILVKRLGQNSMETRRRYAQSIVRWFFPDGLNGLLPRVWLAYQDEAIALDLLRWSYLNQELIIGRCVAEALFPCETGLVMPATYFDKFLQDHLGEAPPDKTRERLKSNLKKIGFLERAKGKPDRLLPVVPTKTSFLILLHHLFAAKAVRTVELRNLVTNPFWKYLGYKSEDTLRAVLREADAAGLVGKYVVADQLEQVTTCFTLDEFMERRARL